MKSWESRQDGEEKLKKFVNVRIAIEKLMNALWLIKVNGVAKHEKT